MSDDPFEALTNTFNGASINNIQWVFKDDRHRWIEYGDTSNNNNEQSKTTAASDDIERAYQQNNFGTYNINSSLQSYVIDFSKMTQTNISTKKVRQVKRVEANNNNKGRRTSIQNNTNQKFEWQFQDENGIWTKYGELSSSNNTAFVTSSQSDDIETAFQQDKTGSFGLKSRKFQYEIDFSAMTQRNTTTKKTRKIRRVAVSESDTRAPNQSHEIDGIQVKYPSVWAPMNGNHFRRIHLNPHDDEYKKVQTLVSPTLANFKILSMARIQNTHLWAAYVNRKNQLQKKYPRIKYADKTLFHGTNVKHIDDICQDNLDVRMAGDAHGEPWYGRGIYFSNKAFISNKFSKSNPKCMLIMKVLIGKYVKVPQGTKIPPGDNDTTVNDEANPTEFVKYDRQEYYPEYYFTYSTT